MVLSPDVDGHRAAPVSEAGDQRVIIENVSWETYEKILELFDERPGLRITYLAGALEIMVPSREHERRKTVIGRLLEAYADHFEIDFDGFGSTTFKNELVERGLEPDECYVIGDPDKELPDIALEVVLSHGIDKLEVYRGLGVPEVWRFEKGRFTVYRLAEDGSRYDARDRSTFLPDLDLELLARFVSWKNQREAVAAFRAEIAKAC
jgi:Uma2 family endonuclease